MSFLPHPALRCPLDRVPLEQQEGCLRCANGHSFDIARQGYVNLLGAQDKRSRDPGDSKAMITARRNFLDAGHYQPVAARLSQLMMPLLAVDSMVIDAGCGEGYYLQYLAESIGAAGKPPPSMLGFDISKWAMRTAARRFAATWLVASNRQIPLADCAADLVLSLFGFPEYPEFQRILRNDGLLVLVNAGPQHLIELREVIYADIRRTVPRHIDDAGEAGFSLVDRSEFRFKTATLDRGSIQQLLSMTPHLFRASREGKRKVAALTELQLTVDVVFEVLQRTR